MGTSIPRSSLTSSSSISPTCTTAVPGKYGAVPLDACNSYYNFYPSFGAAVAFAALFGMVLLVHIGQAVHFRKRFCWVIIMASAWETASFVLRALGSRNQQQLGYEIAFTLLLLLAPLWINAFVYMTVARMVHFFLPEKKIRGVKAKSMTKIWVWLDIISFLIQGIGGSMLSGNPPEHQLKIGIDIYMCGIGFQQLSILVFVFVATRFHARMNQLDRERLLDRSVNWRWLLYALYAVLALITIRIIYRLCEFSRGVSSNNTMITHEVYVYVLDATPMFFACLLLNVCHPGLVLRGPNSEFPRLSRSEKKALKREKKAEKQRKKDAKKNAKLARNQAKKEGQEEAAV